MLIHEKYKIILKKGFNLPFKVINPQKMAQNTNF